MSWDRKDFPDTGANVFEGKIVSESFTGKLVDYTIKIGDQLMEIQMPLHGEHRNEPDVFFRLPPERCVMLPKDEVGSAWR
jgi:hypothetical protein